MFFTFIQTTGAAAAKFVCGTGKGKAGAEPAGMGLTQSSRLWLTAGGKRPWARRKSARGELLGEGWFTRCPGKAGGALCS